MAAQEFVALVAFVVVYAVFGIYAATATAMVTGVAHALYTYHRVGKVDAFQLASLGLILVFGGATLILHDEMFLKIKPTVLYFIVSLAFLGSHFFGTRLLSQRIFERSEVKIANPSVWVVSNIAWMVGLVCLGTLNLYVAWNFETSVWVYFKLLGTTSLLGMGVCVQMSYLQSNAEARYVDFRQELMDQLAEGDTASPGTPPMSSLIPGSQV